MAAHATTGGPAPLAADDDRAVYIAGMARTPMGNFSGALAALTAPQLGAAAIRGTAPIARRAHQGCDLG